MNRSRFFSFLYSTISFVCFVLFKTKNTKDIAEYEKQKNTVVRLNKALKKICNENLDRNEVGENKVLSRTLGLCCQAIVKWVK